MILFPILLIGIIVLYLVGFYNKLKTIKVRINAAIQEIGNQLKRQAELIPNLVASAKGYMKHEEKALQLITDARKTVLEAAGSTNMAKIDKAQDLLQKAIGSFKVVLESTPQLQAVGVVTSLMDELRDTADKVMYSRRTMIDLSADYNTAISTIPGVWLAPFFGFKSEAGLSTPQSGEFLKVSDSDTNSPKVDF